MEDGKETLRDLQTGIVLLVILLEIAGILFASGKMSFCLGSLLGGIVAILLSIHMYTTLDTALEMEEGAATKYVRKKTGIRMIIMGLAVICGCIFPEVFHVLGVAAGILTLKISAYLQPMIHKYIVVKIFHKGR